MYTSQFGAHRRHPSLRSDSDSPIMTSSPTSQFVDPAWLHMRSSQQLHHQQQQQQQQQQQYGKFPSAVKVSSPTNGFIRESTLQSNTSASMKDQQAEAGLSALFRSQSNTRRGTGLMESRSIHDLDILEEHTPLTSPPPPPPLSTLSGANWVGNNEDPFGMNDEYMFIENDTPSTVTPSSVSRPLNMNIPRSALINTPSSLSRQKQDHTWDPTAKTSILSASPDDLVMSHLGLQSMSVPTAETDWRSLNAFVSHGSSGFDTAEASPTGMLSSSFQFGINNPHHGVNYSKLLLEDKTAAVEQAQLIFDKRRRRRESHNLVERRRRDHINEKIQELGSLIPESMLAAACGGDLDVGLGSAVNNAGKPNKGIILKKSVDYIQQLQQLVHQQAIRIKELEERDQHRQ